MPNFDRRSLAKFLPDPKSIIDFENLNKAVDVDLPESIDGSSALAQQALNTANEAISRIEEVIDRFSAFELLPPSIPDDVADDLAPVTIMDYLFDNVAPINLAP